MLGTKFLKVKYNNKTFIINNAIKNNMTKNLQ